MQIEGGELYVEVVLFLKSFDLNEADIAPRSDEVRNDDDRCALAFGVFCFFDVFFSHTRIVLWTILGAYRILRCQSSETYEEGGTA